MAAQTELAARFACPDWWERLQAGQVPFAPVPLDESKASKALWFFDQLKLPDGVAAGTPLRDACGDWFREILAAFLASSDPVTAARLVWECLVMVPKKNSKTTYTAALGLTALFVSDVQNGQMLIIAPSQNISDRCFAQIARMIRMDERLSKAFKIQEHLKTVTRYATGTSIQVKTFDTQIITGEIPVLTIIDELHELGKKNGAAAVMQQIRGGSVTETGGQLMMITTQSDKTPTGIWKTELTKARNIRDGKGGASPIMLPVLYEFPEALQRDRGYWRDMANWPVVLPNLGRSINAQRLQEDFENNGSVNVEAERIWASQHLNIQIGVGLQDDRWSGADYWDGAAIPDMTLDALVARAEVCTVGIDPGGHDDLLSLSVIGRCAATGEWLQWQQSWADRKVLELRKSIAAELQDFAKAGELVLVDALEVEALPELVAICHRLSDAGLVPEKNWIGIDAAGGAAGLVADALEAAGYKAGAQLVPISQGYRLNAVSGLCVIKLKGRSMRHSNQAIMAWAVANAQTEARGNTVIISKSQSGTAKIDPLMSLFDAAELMSLHPQAGGGGAISIPADYAVA